MSPNDLIRFSSPHQLDNVEMSVVADDLGNTDAWKYRLRPCCCRLLLATPAVVGLIRDVPENGSQEDVSIPEEPQSEFSIAPPLAISRHPCTSGVGFPGLGGVARLQA